MKQQKEKTDKKQTKKWKLERSLYDWYYQWCRNATYDPSPMLYKMHKWICYILGFAFIFLGIILGVMDIINQCLTGDRLKGYVIFILGGLFFIFYLSRNSPFFIIMYGDAKIEEWKAQEREENRQKKQRNNEK